MSTRQYDACINSSFGYSRACLLALDVTDILGHWPIGPSRPPCIALRHTYSLLFAAQRRTLAEICSGIYLEQVFLCLFYGMLHVVMTVLVFKLCSSSATQSRLDYTTTSVLVQVRADNSEPSHCAASKQQRLYSLHHIHMVASSAPMGLPTM